MSLQNQPELPAKIYAEAVVRSTSGKSLLNSPALVTSKNVDQFHASPDLCQLAAQRLRKAGFEVLGIGNLSITIAAERNVYERALATTLEAVERPVIKELGQAGSATFINAVDDKPFGEIDVSQTEWAQILDGIVFNEPIYYFQTGLPSAVSPPTPNDYLSVPEGVAQGLNAVLAHQQGMTGKGVKVVMVDSGWYCHPFFTKHQYSVQVALAPGSSDKTRDESGHGTGESANLLAIAPDVSLTMVKADVALDGQQKNVNSIAALRAAVDLQPDIISCSWGTDQRRSELSPYNRRLAAAVAEAVRRGIIVIFSAGNGHYGFPAQHPEVIAAGGVYQHLNGSLRGRLEASSYASSFTSPVYPQRQVPDVCGLVGMLPHASYIMLPVPPGCRVDQQLALCKDGTEATDGWAAFSGTSAAAPQLAGICALIKQANPKLSPAEVRKILQQTAHDVTEGCTNPSSSGAPARAGPDAATGYGLVNAHAAVEVAKSLVNQQCCNSCASKVQPFSPFNSRPSRRQPMYSQFPKLQKELDQLLWKFEKKLQRAIKKHELEDVELSISAANFIPRSSVAKIAYSLRDTLDKCLDKEGKIEPTKITQSHISAAQGLLKLGKYQSAAIDVLTQALLLDAQADTNLKKVSELASDALSQCAAEIASFDNADKHETALLDGGFSCVDNKCFWNGEPTNQSCKHFNDCRPW